MKLGSDVDERRSERRSEHVPLRAPESGGGDGQQLQAPARSPQLFGTSDNPLQIHLSPAQSPQSHAVLSACCGGVALLRTQARRLSSALPTRRARCPPLAEPQTGLQAAPQRRLRSSLCTAMQRYARAASQAMRRGFHSSSAAQSGGGADYEHRTNMVRMRLDALCAAWGGVQGMTGGLGERPDRCALCHPPPRSLVRRRRRNPAAGRAAYRWLLTRTLGTSKQRSCSETYGAAMPRLQPHHMLRLPPFLSAVRAVEHEEPQAQGGEATGTAALQRPGATNMPCCFCMPAAAVCGMQPECHWSSCPAALPSLPADGPGRRRRGEPGHRHPHGRGAAAVLEGQGLISGTYDDDGRQGGASAPAAASASQWHTHPGHHTTDKPTAAAATWPQRPFRLVLPFAAGLCGSAAALLQLAPPAGGRAQAAADAPPLAHAPPYLYPPWRSPPRRQHSPRFHCATLLVASKMHIALHTPCNRQDGRPPGLSSGQHGLHSWARRVRSAGRVAREACRAGRASGYMVGHSGRRSALHAAVEPCRGVIEQYAASL